MVEEKPTRYSGLEQAGLFLEQREGFVDSLTSV